MLPGEIFSGIWEIPRQSIKSPLETTRQSYRKGLNGFLLCLWMDTFGTLAVLPCSRLLLLPSLLGNSGLESLT